MENIERGRPFTSSRSRQDDNFKVELKRTELNLMFCWPCIIVYQCIETKWNCNRVTALQLTLYARSIPNTVCAVPPEDEQVMLETCRGLWFSIKWMKSASRWFHYTGAELKLYTYCSPNPQTWLRIEPSGRSLSVEQWMLKFKKKVTNLLDR
jgi:hypothetical protein